MDEMRQVLQEGQVEERVQYLVEGLFKIQRDGFDKSGHSQIPAGLDLVEDADKFEVVFDINEDVPQIQQMLNVFKADPEYEEHEEEYEVGGSTIFAARRGRGVSFTISSPMVCGGMVGR
jgi:pre-mRNA-splicing factor CWC22